MAGLYIHIPFCHSKCYYCDFYSRPCRGGEEQIRAYVNALLREWQLRRNEIDEPVTTLYLGGGTPSILPMATLAQLVDGLALDGPPTEATIEANPEDVTPEWTAAVKRLGFNRVSIGVQSVVNEELAAVGRRHTGAEAIRAIATLSEGGITNISADLIYGLPGQTEQSWQRSLDAVLGLQAITHLSAYSLSYEDGTRLSAKLRAGKIEAATDDAVARFYSMLCQSAADHGFEHYEISNFARPGHRARHNSSYWDFTPYIGLGCAAHSFDGSKRRANVADLTSYLSCLNRGVTACSVEEESPTDLINDYIITRLRTSEGLYLADMEQRFGTEVTHRLLTDGHRWLTTGKLTHLQKPQRLVITEPGWLVSDAIMRDLLQD